MRLFVSVDLPPALVEPIETLQETLSRAPGLRPTDPAQAHITLFFLGGVDDDRVPEITAALEDAIAPLELAPFEAQIGGLGVFPSLEYIRVVWLGVQWGVTGLEVLHEAVVDALEPLGFEPDDHAFTPHVTIGRMDHAGGKSHVQSVVEERTPTVGTMIVDRFSLTESVLTEDGPRYRTVTDFSLE